MSMILVIGTGGALGAVGRYLINSWVAQVMGTQFPWGILVVNILGGLAMGVIAELGAQSMTMAQETRAFLTTGILGGFTTFSAFSLDTALLIERGELLNASVYVLASVIGSVGALFAGLYLVRLASA